jgi:hypothetical protein
MTFDEANEVLDLVEKGSVRLRALLSDFPIKSGSSFEVRDNTLGNAIQECQEMKNAILALSDFERSLPIRLYSGSIAGQDAARFEHLIVVSAEWLGVEQAMAVKIMARAANIKSNEFIGLATQTVKDTPRGKLALAAVAQAGAFVSSVTAPVAASSIEDAFAAYDRGDYVTALLLFRPLADQHNARAQFVLGNMYANGEGVQQDYVAAIKWYRLSADQGYVLAQTNLGRMYSSGEGVPQNDVDAIKWWLKAAKQGFAHAQHDIGVMYAKGLGVPQDYAEAAKWYRLAADQGDDYAQDNLGTLYAQGLGVPQDYVRALMWFNLAARTGSQEAVDNRDHAARLMTPAQIAEAQKLASEWKPK